MSATEKALEGTGKYLDDRFHGARGLRVFLRKVFPDHWSFLLGEIALYSFIILLLTGTFLTLFFQPSMTDVVYHGSYTPLDGVHMSEAYASTLNISFDVRGGCSCARSTTGRRSCSWPRSCATCCGCSSPGLSASRASSTGSSEWCCSLWPLPRACSDTRCPTTCCPAPGCASSKAYCSRFPLSART